MLKLLHVFNAISGRVVTSLPSALTVDLEPVLNTP